MNYTPPLPDSTQPGAPSQPWCVDPSSDGICSSPISPFGTGSSWWLSFGAGWNTHSRLDEYALVVDPDNTGDHTIDIPITAAQATALAATIGQEAR